ncbi:MAG: hypothetical protein ACI936_003627 [Paraglaciecola sp.]|jgi:hypothetical protein
MIFKKLKKPKVVKLKVGVFELFRDKRSLGFLDVI